MIFSWVEFSYIRDKARDAYHQSEVAALGLKARVDHHIGIEFGHASMFVKDFYMH